MLITAHDSVELAGATSGTIPTPGLVPGRLLLVFDYYASATITVTGVVDQAGVALPVTEIINASSSASRTRCYRMRVPASPPTSVRINVSAAVGQQIFYVELSGDDTALPVDVDACVADSLNAVAGTTFLIGPTPGDVDLPGSLAFAFVGLHNNVGAFKPWGSGFTSIGDDRTRTSLATKTVSEGNVEATANWNNTLFGSGLIVTIRPNVGTAPVVDAGANVSGAAADASISRTATVTDADGDTGHTWTWTLEAAPAASTLTSADIVGRFTASISFTPDVECEPGEVYRLRATAADADGLTGYDEFDLSVVAADESIPFFMYLDGVLVALPAPSKFYFVGVEVPPPPPPPTNALTTQAGDSLITQAGDELEVAV